MYRVLYRKYRPQTFEQVVGQPHVTATLTHELEAGRLSHAYLFTGIRGTGKTTCSLILARAVNCLQPVKGNPCNECEICRGISDGTIMDVIEIDAASNNGVDNIRDLREEANFTPVRTTYRVYIIDEVHMLTVQAFNALLKIMEEPPAHVIFILATTEVHKIPSTILSRCQRFDFRRLTPEDNAVHLCSVARAEGFTLEEDAALLIARIADGASRDALNLLDRCLSQSAASEHPVVDAALVTKAAGITDKDAVFRLTQCIAEEDASAALTLLHSLYIESCDMEQLCRALVFHLRDLLVAKTVQESRNLLVCTDADFARLSAQEKLFSTPRLLLLLHKMEAALAAVRREMNKRILLELTLIELCSPLTDSGVQGLTARVAALEEKLSLHQNALPQTPLQSGSPAAAPPSQTESPPSFSEQTGSSLREELLAVLQRSNPALHSLLNTSQIRFSQDECLIEENTPALRQFLDIPANKTAFLQALSQAAGRPVFFRFLLEPADENDPLAGLKKKIETMQ